ncbi:MAG: hypothetical protein IPJ88_12875 [Myxococcales bacterium]|nr:MAG: hypothetical protein IPJ88_12875 [Myxococcales bacterium]
MTESHTSSVSNCLGTLQGDPYNISAADSLRTIFKQHQPERSELELLKTASELHVQRGEWAAAAALLELLLEFSTKKRDEEKAELWALLGELRAERLFDPKGALEAFEKARQLDPSDPRIVEEQDKLSRLGSDWKVLVGKKSKQLEKIADPTEKARLLREIASIRQSFAGDFDEAARSFGESFQLNPRDRQTVLLYAGLLGAQGQWNELVEVLLQSAESARGSDDKILFFEQAARVLRDRLKQPERAVACYERIVSFHPAHKEALAYLAEWFTSQERWDDLVALYEGALRSDRHIQDEEGALLQVAMIHWKKRQSPTDAEPYFARLRKHSPAHPVVLDFFQNTLRQVADQPRLLAILTEAQRAANDDNTRLDLAVKIAKVASENSVTAERAIDAWRQVQKIDPDHPDTFAALKTLYRNFEKWNALAELLKDEVEKLPATATVAKTDLLYELLAVYDSELHSDVMVANTYLSILEIDSEDRKALDGLIQRYQKMERWNDAITYIEQRAALAEDSSERAESYRTIAKIWLDRLGNHAEAARCLQEIRRLFPEDQSPLQELKDIYTKRRAWAELYALLESELSAQSTASQKISTLKELATLAENQLGNDDKALELWRKISELDEKDPESDDSITRLASKTGQWETLVKNLESQLETLSAEQRNRTIERIAGIYTDQLKQAKTANKFWRLLLKYEPQNVKAIRSLRTSLLSNHDWDGIEAIYEKTGEWEALIDVLSSAADRISDPAQKIELSLRVARVFEEKLDAPARAFRSYERILSVDPGHVRAANALVPIYEREEKWNRLVGVLQILLRQASDDGETTLHLLKRLARLSIEKLRDPELAFEHSKAALAIDPDDQEAFEILQNAAKQTARHADFVEALELSLQQISNTEHRARIQFQLAVSYANDLEDEERALPYFKAVFDQSPGDTVAFHELEKAYLNTKAWKELKKLYLRRIEQETAPMAARQLHLSLARIAEEGLHDLDIAKHHYTQALDIEPSDVETLDQLLRIALEHSQWDERELLLERKLDWTSTDEERFLLHLECGKLLRDKLEQDERAIEMFFQAARDKGSHPELLHELNLTAQKSHALAAQIDPYLLDSYESAGDVAHVLEVLERSLAYSEDKQAIRLRIASLRGEQDDAQGQYSALEAAFKAEPWQRELWEKIIEAGKKASVEKKLCKLFRKTLEKGQLSESDDVDLSRKLAQLYETSLRNASGLEWSLKRILSIEPLDSDAYETLRSSYLNDEKWEALETLYQDHIDASIDYEEKTKTLLLLCFLYEEITDNPVSAAKAYRQVLDINPEHLRSRRALERLFVRTKDWENLAVLLREAIDQTTGQEQIDAAFQLGEVYEKYLNDLTGAIDQYSYILVEQPTHLRAQEGLEGLLENKDHRSRVAAILEPLFESQGAYAELARVLRVQLEDIEDQSTRTATYHRIAELQEQRLRDPRAAFDTLSVAFSEDPSDMLVREELLRLAEATDCLPSFAQLLEEKTKSLTDDVPLAKDLLRDLGMLWGDKEHNLEKAKESYQRLVEIDVDDLDSTVDASRKLAEIQRQLNDTTGLVQTLGYLAEYEYDAERQHHALIEQSQLLHYKLENFPAAIAAYQKRLDLDSRDRDAILGLEELLQPESHGEELVQVLRAHYEIAEAETEKKAALKRVAEVLENALQQNEEAISVLEDAEAEFGADNDTLQMLARLYEKAARWENLVETLWKLRDRSPDVEERNALNFHVAEVFSRHMHETERAIESLASILAVDSLHGDAVLMLQGYLSDDTLATRVAAARVLSTVSTQNEQHDQLVDALEIVAESDNHSEAYSSFVRAARLALEKLEDSERAFALMAKAALCCPSETDLAQLLPELNEIAAKAGKWPQLVEIYKEIGPNILDEDLHVTTLGSVADIARLKLQDHKLAEKYYELVLERRADDAAALDALEEINAAQGNHQGLLEVLQRKTALLDNPVARVHLLLRQGDIAEHDLSDSSAAIEAYEQVMQESRRGEAFDALERLYEKTERWVDLVFLYEKALEEEQGDTAQIHTRLGIVLFEHRDDSDEGSRHFEQALELQPEFAPAREYLEKLVFDEDAIDKAIVAAQLLEPVLLQTMDWKRLVAVMQNHIELVTNPSDKKELLYRLAEIFEDHLEDLDGAFSTYVRVFRLDPFEKEARDSSLRLARVLEKWEECASVFEDVFEDITDTTLAIEIGMTSASIREERMLDAGPTASVLERVIDWDPTNEKALALLQSSLWRSASYEKLASLYENLALHAADPIERVEFLLKRANLLRETLADNARAIESYLLVLEDEPEQQDAFSALCELFQSENDWQAYSKLLESQSDRLAGKNEEHSVRMEHVRVLIEHLSDANSALRILEQAAHSFPQRGEYLNKLEELVQKPALHDPVTLILQELYRSFDQWKKLIAVNEARLDIINTTEQKLALLREIAALQEDRNKHHAWALDAWSRAFMLEPDQKQIQRRNASLS